MNVIRFPEERVRKPITRFSWQKEENDLWPLQCYVFDSIHEERPEGHPPLRFGPRGKVLLDVGQVWIAENNELWTIQSLQQLRHGMKRAYLSRYKHPYVIRSLAESTLRRVMVVWDVEVRERKEMLLQWLVECELRGIDPRTENPID